MVCSNKTAMTMLVGARKKDGSGEGGAMLTRVRVFLRPYKPTAFDFVWSREEDDEEIV